MLTHQLTVEWAWTRRCLICVKVLRRRRVILYAFLRTRTSFAMPFLTRNRRRWIAVSGCLSSTMPVSEAGCEEHQQAAPNELLCRTHMQAETQTLDLAKPASVLAFDAPVLVLAPHSAVVRTPTGVRMPATVPVAGAPPPLVVLYSRYLT